MCLTYWKGRFRKQFPDILSRHTWLERPFHRPNDFNACPYSFSSIVVFKKYVDKEA